MRSDKEQTTLFERTAESPLSERQRPKTLKDFAGQKHFLNAQFERLLQSDNWVGFVFWGPPGTGKTTLASLIASTTHRVFHSLSAVTSGVKDIREVLEASKIEVRMGRKAQILFIDEVHRLNKAQQDVLLPYLERGEIRFIGATTENPSFEINKAICSRCVIFNFKALSEQDLLLILENAAKGRDIEKEVLEEISRAAIGDGRRALILLEHLFLSVEKNEKITKESFDKLSHAQNLYYDKHSESHYDTISAFIKSVRGSDPDASLYYLARMLEAGEDPVFIARRLVILASEDIGNANPSALMLATSGFQAVHAIGMPEARIILSQVTTYLSCSEKSNRSYRAIDKAIEVAKKTGALEIPYSIRNAVTGQMKSWGYGEGYKYAHNYDEAWTPMQFLPDAIKDLKFYEPSNQGREKQLQEFLARRKARPSKDQM